MTIFSAVKFRFGIKDGEPVCYYWQNEL